LILVVLNVNVDQRKCITIIAGHECFIEVYQMITRIDLDRMTSTTRTIAISKNTILAYKSRPFESFYPLFDWGQIDSGFTKFISRNSDQRVLSDQLVLVDDSYPFENNGWKIM